MLTPKAAIEIDIQSLDSLATIARGAGAAAMMHYDSPTVELKGDRSPVTAADRAAHFMVIDGLTKWVPGVPVISEEGTIPPFSERREWSLFWLVDPLDG